LRGDLNQNRKTQVKLAFEGIDKGGKGVICFDELKRYFNVQTHPKFISGEMNATECLQEFAA
jgi:Ca2+-binding EF-hand superfamily protein